MPEKDLLIVFDLVSTLTDAGPRYVRAFAEVCAAQGFGMPDEQEITAMLGNKNLGEITDHFAGPLDGQKKKEFMAACNKTCDALLMRPDWQEHLFPNVRETVETLHLRGVTLGIYTGTREDAMAAQLSYHGLNDIFDPRYLRGKDNTRDAGKHNNDLKAEQLRSLVEQFRQDTGSKDAPIVVIGDSEADAQAAASLGLFFVGFAAEEKKKQHLEQAGVKDMLRDFGDLPDLAERLCCPAVNDNHPSVQALKVAPPKP